MTKECSLTGLIGDRLLSKSPRNSLYATTQIGREICEYSPFVPEGRKVQATNQGRTRRPGQQWSKHIRQQTNRTWSRKQQLWMPECECNNNRLVSTWPLHTKTTASVTTKQIWRHDNSKNHTVIKIAWVRAHGTLNGGGLYPVFYAGATKRPWTSLNE